MTFRAIAFALSLTALLVSADPASAGRQQTTELISRAADGRAADGASSRAVISGDRRYARVIAFESEATNLVSGDTNALSDVFAVTRGGSVNNRGTAWRPGRTVLISRGAGGEPANGPSYGAAVSGDFRHPGRCIAFVSEASNLVAGDTDATADAFLAASAGRSPRLVSSAGGNVMQVAVSGDCSRVSYIADGRLYTSVGGRAARLVRTRGGIAFDPSYATGNSNALVYATRSGVWLSSNGTTRGRLVARGGRNPVFNDIKRRTLAYEKVVRGSIQIGYRDLGRRERIISANRRRRGNGDSRNPVIGNSGFYVTFESDASNLTTNAGGATADDNRRTDSYLFTDARDLTTVQSVFALGEPMPGGGQNPSMSFYANYIVFHSPGRDATGRPQIYLRYLGGI